MIIVYISNNQLSTQNISRLHVASEYGAKPNDFLKTITYR